mgnify:CR=1 FL=1
MKFDFHLPRAASVIFRMSFTRPGIFRNAGTGLISFVSLSIMTAVPTLDKARRVAPQLSTYYYGFNLDKPLFAKNPKLRWFHSETPNYGAALKQGIQLEGVRFSYGERRALDGLTLTAGDGGVVLGRGGAIVLGAPILHDVGTLGAGSGMRLGQALTGLDDLGWKALAVNVSDVAAMRELEACAAEGWPVNEAVPPVSHTSSPDGVAPEPGFAG